MLSSCIIFRTGLKKKIMLSLAKFSFTGRKDATLAIINYKLCRNIETVSIIPVPCWFSRTFSKLSDVTS